MPKVQVTHKKLTDPNAKKAPRRDPVPVGRYHSIIMNVSQGTTKHDEPLLKITCEFQLVALIKEEGELEEKGIQGRRVYQDFIIQHSDDMPDMSERWRYELVSLLDATDVEYDDEGFDTDDLMQKPVIITVRHREGDKVDDNGEPIIFTNVKKVESPEEVDEDELI